MKDKTIYTEDSIQTLDAKSHIQLRSGMYIGSNENPDNLLKEAFSNALDEYAIGHGNLINVDIQNYSKEKYPDSTTKYDWITVVDGGQGFPINEIREDGESVFQASFDQVNTSGKFSEDGVYSGTSGGLNGLGSKIINFLSKECNVSTWNNEHYEWLSFVNGELKERHTGKIGDKWFGSPGSTNNYTKSGTIVSYSPSSKYFKSTKTNEKYFENYFNDITCLCNDLTIRLNGYDIQHDSIEDAIARKTKGNADLLDKHLIIDTDNFKCAMTFTDSNSCNIIEYVNLIESTAGPHITGTKSTITRIINNWARQNGLLKEKEKNLSGNDIQEGMFLFCNITSKNVSYVAQVKSEIASLDTSFLSILSDRFELWLDENPEEGKKIVERALLARKASEAAKKARNAVKNKVKNKNNNLKMPTTLVDCHCKDRTKAELFICEGKSAQGGLVSGRQASTQAVYGVRGKMLSVLKTKPENIIKNQEINNLLTALGLDYNPKNCKCVFDKNKLRYGKIIAAADADSDGAAIENLLFNILWYICPELIINGYVYSSVPPLFRVTTKKNEYVYLKDDKALQEYKEEHSNEIQSVGREKGLGEMDSDELAYALLDENTRNIQQLTVDDIQETNQMFNDLYGKKVEPRVKFLSEHLEEANIE